MPDNTNDWKLEKLRAEEDKVMDALHDQAMAQVKGHDAPRPADLPAEDVPLDPVAEQAAFAELLKVFAETADDDTDVVALTAEEFAEADFTPFAETEINTHAEEA